MNLEKCLCGGQLETFRFCLCCAQSMDGKKVCVNSACKEFVEQLCEACKNRAACEASAVSEECEEAAL